MAEYSVLLADDEENVIQVIRKKIDWKSLGFEVIQTADNGVKALELAEEFQPDVVMTDIKMPYMDGMELAKRLKEKYPDIKILLFSGFDEFEYAKEAIHLEVEEYILKPVSAGELTEVLQRLKTKLDEEISRRQNLETLQQYYLDSLPLLRANFFTSLVEGTISKEEILHHRSYYQIDLPGPLFCCFVIHTSAAKIPEGMSFPLLVASVQKEAADYFTSKWRANSFSYQGNITVITQLEKESQIPDLTDACDRFCRRMLRVPGAVVTIGIGRLCKSCEQLHHSYSSAREAVSYRALYGSSRAINIREAAPKELAPVSFDGDRDIADLIKAIRLNGEKEIAEAVDAYMEHIKAPLSLQQHQIDVMELVGEFYRFSMQNGIVPDGLSGDINALCVRLAEFEQEAMRNWLLKTGLSFREQLLSARKQSTRSFVINAVGYVKAHYQDKELSLDTICEELGVSNSYFSTIFKKETNQSFIGYLTDYRMEQAAKLLLQTDEKSYMIAEYVGYSDPNYFSYVFKRKFGVSPSKYRTEHAAYEN